jgi:hypothetical protein
LRPQQAKRPIADFHGGPVVALSRFEPAVKLNARNSLEGLPEQPAGI